MEKKSEHKIGTSIIIGNIIIACSNILMAIILGSAIVESTLH
ncbi:hypothetical protein [Peptoniphilus senegalensis]|uniref:Cation transporter n=1 Tax=Peptoniphilus senegalensis TaxID=1465757 RepID=A0ABV1J1J5_9FIRM